MDKISPHDAEEDAHNADIRIWVDGALKHRDQAVVPVDESGSMLGDGVWQDLRLYNRRWTFLDEHSARLFDAAKAIGLCHSDDIPCRARHFSVIAAYCADGAFLTGDIGPVTTRFRALDKAVVTP